MNEKLEAWLLGALVVVLAVLAVDVSVIVSVVIFPEWWLT